MNNTPETEQLLDNAATKLEVQTGHCLRFEPPPLATGRLQIDATATLAADTKQKKFVVEVKPHLTTQNLDIVVNHLNAVAHQTNLRPLLVARYVNPEIAKRLRGDGINYIDAAGNAHLRAGQNIYIDIQGQRMPTLPVQPRNLGRKGLQLAALILAHPEYLNYTHRDLAEAAGVALGTVPTTLADLQTRGIIGQAGPKELALRDGDALLELWVRGYTDVQRPKLLVNRYRLAPHVDLPDLPQALTAAGARHILVGGEAAGAAYTNYLRPTGATLHLMDKAAKLPPKLLLPDARGHVDVLQGFGAPKHWKGTIPGYVHPLLVYGELLAIGAHDRRLVETAKYLREQHGLGKA